MPRASDVPVEGEGVVGIDVVALDGFSRAIVPVVKGDGGVGVGLPVLDGVARAVVPVVEGGSGGCVSASCP